MIENGRETNRTYKKKLVLKKSVKKFINKCLLLLVIFLFGMILVKSNKDYKNFILENIYNKNIKFTKFKSMYQKYFGNILSIDKIVKEEKSVFNEKLNYKKASVYKDGAVLRVSNNLMVPVLESGVVVYKGKKDDYGNVIIIEQVDGVDVFYGNIKNDNINLYDYVEKGELLGEVSGNKLYLVFQKDGKYLDYKEFI